MAVPSLAERWRLARAVDRLVSLEKRNSDAFAEVTQRLDKIESRLSRIEVVRELMVIVSKAAAATAASAAASAQLAGLAQAPGGLEERVRQLSAAVPIRASAPKRKRPMV